MDKSNGANFLMGSAFDPCPDQLKVIIIVMIVSISWKAGPPIFTVIASRNSFRSSEHRYYHRLGAKYQFI